VSGSNGDGILEERDCDGYFDVDEGEEGGEKERLRKEYNVTYEK
jgi:hypothetical protein